jgi:hypothetical protein
MQNGTRKGGAVPVFETLRKSPGFEDVWQLHWSYAAGIEHNAPGVFIANVDDPATIAGVLTAPAGGGGGRGGGAAAHTPAYYIRVSVQADGTFTVTNTRNGFSKTYAKQGKEARFSVASSVSRPTSSVSSPSGSGRRIRLSW